MTITGNYTLTANPEWKNVQNQDLFIDCDTTLADVNLTLPSIASLNLFWGIRIHVLHKAGANKVNIIGFTQVSPSVTNKISGVASVQLATLGDSAIVTVEDGTNWVSALTTGTTGLPKVVATLAKADLATATYTVLPIGSTLAVVDYAGSGEGMTITRTTLANNTFADWTITATTAKASTNSIGQTPK